MLSIENIGKVYPQQKDWAVKNISFSLEEGTFISLVGESGCGKSTLLRLIAGFEDASEGKILLDNEEITGPSSNLVAGYEQIQLVHQDFNLPPNDRIHEIIRRPLRKFTLKYQEYRQNLVIELCGLQPFLNKYAWELSGGEQQRVAIARALANEPKLLLLDEPFSNIDQFFRRELIDEFQQIIKKTNTTAIFVTHETLETLGISDQIAIMQNGKVLQFDTPEKVYNQPVSHYTGKLFGTVNIFKSNFLNGHIRRKLALPPVFSSIGIRSENIELVESKEADFIGQIVSVKFLGTYYLWEVLIGNTISILVNTPRKLELSSSEIGISFKKESVIIFE